MIFINITISISENGINYNVFQVKTSYKILTVSPRRRNSRNGDETTTANAPDRSSRAHACQCEFTSGSRPGSSRPAILRSLFLGRPLLRFPSRVQCRAVFAIEAFSQGTRCYAEKYWLQIPLLGRIGMLPRKMISQKPKIKEKRT